MIYKLCLAIRKQKSEDSLIASIYDLNIIHAEDKFDGKRIKNTRADTQILA